MGWLLRELDELCMTREKLDNWAQLALQLKIIAHDYDPEGMVKHMDVFYTGPLLVWGRLGPWRSGESSYFECSMIF